MQKIRHIIGDTYRQHRYLLDALCFTEAEKHQFTKVMNCEMDDVTAQDALKNLSYYLHHYWRKRTILLLDEYDTPMQEAYVHGYWNEFINFIRGLFNSALKTNPYLERAVMTGITRVSKESVFSDLNNLKVITITSEEYADCLVLRMALSLEACMIFTIHGLSPIIWTPESCSRSGHQQVLTVW